MVDRILRRLRRLRERQGLDLGRVMPRDEHADASGLG